MKWGEGIDEDTSIILARMAKKSPSVEVMNKLLGEVREQVMGTSGEMSGTLQSGENTVASPQPVQAANW